MRTWLLALLFLAIHFPLLADDIPLKSGGIEFENNFLESLAQPVSIHSKTAPEGFGGPFQSKSWLLVGLLSGQRFGGKPEPVLRIAFDESGGTDTGHDTFYVDTDGDLDFSGEQAHRLEGDRAVVRVRLGEERIETTLLVHSPMSLETISLQEDIPWRIPERIRGRLEEMGISTSKIENFVDNTRYELADLLHPFMSEPWWPRWSERFGFGSLKAEMDWYFRIHAASGYRGKIDLQGKTWTVGAIDLDLDGKFSSRDFGGDLIFVDRDGNGRIGADEVQAVGTPVVIGKKIYTVETPESGQTLTIVESGKRPAILRCPPSMVGARLTLSPEGAFQQITVDLADGVVVAPGKYRFQYELRKTNVQGKTWRAILGSAWDEEKILTLEPGENQLDEVDLSLKAKIEMTDVGSEAAFTMRFVSGVDGPVFLLEESGICTPRLTVTGRGGEVLLDETFEPG